jgi:hypothetical protein
MGRNTSSHFVNFNCSWKNASALAADDVGTEAAVEAEEDDSSWRLEDDSSWMQPRLRLFDLLLCSLRCLVVFFFFVFVFFFFFVTGAGKITIIQSEND